MPAYLRRADLVVLPVSRRSSSPACSTRRSRSASRWCSRAVGGFPEVAERHGAARLVPPGRRRGAGRRRIAEPARRPRRARRAGRRRPRAPPPAPTPGTRSAAQTLALYRRAARRADNRAVLAVLFWVSAGLLVYTHVGYPLRAVAAGAAARARRGAAAPAGGELPSVSLIVAAHDEEEVIARKVAQRARARLPARAARADRRLGRLDGPHRRARPRGRAPTSVLDLPRAGKVAAQNAGAAQARGQIVLAFSDANAFWAPEALRAPGRAVRRPPRGLRLRPGALHAPAAGPTRRAPTGATRWRSASSSQASAGSPPATGRSTRCAASAYMRSARSRSHDLSFPFRDGEARLARACTRPARWRGADGADAGGRVRAASGG